MSRKHIKKKQMQKVKEAAIFPHRCKYMTTARDSHRKSQKGEHLLAFIEGGTVRDQGLRAG